MMAKHSNTCAMCKDQEWHSEFCFAFAANSSHCASIWFSIVYLRLLRKDLLSHLFFCVALLFEAFQLLEYQVLGGSLFQILSGNWPLPSVPRGPPLRRGEPYLPVAGAGKLSQKVEFPLSYKLTSPPFIFIAMVTAMLWGGATQNYEETKVKGDFF